jgi:hypothetical protein
LRQQLAEWTAKLKAVGGQPELVGQIETLQGQLTQIEETLYQTKLQSAQDPLNFPIRLNNRLSGLVGVVASGDFRPTRQAYQVRDEVVALIDVQLARFQQLSAQELEALNAAIAAANIPPVTLPDADKDRVP